MILRIILILVIIYYVFKLIGRIFLPIFMTNRIRKMEEQKENAYREYIKRKQKNEGSVTVEYQSDGKTKRNGRFTKPSDDEEYVDYEEIK